MQLIARMHSTLSGDEPYDTKPFDSHDEETMNIIYLMLGSALFGTSNLTQVDLCVADTKVPIKTIKVERIDLKLFMEAFKTSGE